jgi:hypothetical protein
MEQTMLAETYLELLKDPNHLLYEITLIILIDGLILGLAYPFIKNKIKQHDKVHHDHICEEEDE